MSPNKENHAAPITHHISYPNIQWIKSSLENRLTNKLPQIHLKFNFQSKIQKILEVSLVI